MHQDRDTGTFIRILGVAGIIALLSITLVASFLHHSQELSLERQLASAGR